MEYKLINPEKTILYNYPDYDKIRLFHEPDFRQTIRSSQYYYDWLNMTIHGEARFTRSYFHEYSHHLDVVRATNDWYRKYVMKLSMWSQFMNHIVAILIIISTLTLLFGAGITGKHYMYFSSYFQSLYWISMFYLIGMSPVILSTLIDETRADWKAKIFRKRFNRELQCLKQERSRKQG